MSRLAAVVFLLFAATALADEITFFSVADGQVWDTKGSATNVVTDVFQSSWGQMWIRSQPFEGIPLFTYQSVANPSRCLAVTNNDEGAALVLVACAPYDQRQLWASGGQLRLNVFSQRCVKQLAIGARRLPLTQADCAITPLQQWHIWNHTTQSWEEA